MGAKGDGPNRLVAWQRRTGMSGHIRVVAHMEKIDMADRCAVSAHSCDVVLQSAMGEVEVIAFA